MLLSHVIVQYLSDTSMQDKAYSPWPLQIETPTPKFELQVYLESDFFYWNNWLKSQIILQNIFVVIWDE